MKPSILILHASGTNRDGEAARACELADGAPEIVHLNQLRAGERHLAAYDMLLLPGGFSYGDALGAGARWALDLHVFFHDQIHAFVDSGKPVLGICNGFQVLVKAGILPGQLPQTPGAVTWLRSARKVTLTENASGHFECRWVHLASIRRPQPAFREIGALIFARSPAARNFQVRTTLRWMTWHDHAFRYVDADLKGRRRPLSSGQRRWPTSPASSGARGNVVGLTPTRRHVLPIQNPRRRNDQFGIGAVSGICRRCSKLGGLRQLETSLHALIQAARPDFVKYSV
ncbi:MAG: phosphoribosylformylglycinamidine synthase subunit PurQ [Caldilineaceae bacterium]